MQKTNHIHKLKKHKYPKGGAIFFCTLPDCFFKVEVPLALGKETLCNICGNPFIINEATLKLTKPHCNNCGKVKVKDADGKAFYINKKQANPHVLTEIAEETVDDLKNKLQGIVKNIEDEL